MYYALGKIMGAVGIGGVIAGSARTALSHRVRLDLAEAKALRKARRGPLFLTGVLIALLLTVPVVNLLAPIIATAAMVHLFESWRTEGPDTEALSVGGG